MFRNPLRSHKKTSCAPGTQHLKLPHGQFQYFLVSYSQLRIIIKSMNNKLKICSEILSEAMKKSLCNHIISNYRMASFNTFWFLFDDYKINQQYF
jgi:hypothetical protein